MPRRSTLKQRIAATRWQEINTALKYFDGKCAVCGKSILIQRLRPKPHTRLDFRGFAFHHLEYRDGEPRRKNYPKGTKGTWKYKKAVIPFVIKHRSEFLLVDRGCHKLIEDIKQKSRTKPQVIPSLMLAVYLTKT